MPIPVDCPDCFAVLDVPDRLAGKTVRCPDCTARLFVPGGEDEEDERPQSDRPRSVVRAELDRPRKRKKREKGPSAGVMLGVAVGIVVVLGTAVGVAMTARPGSRGVTPEPTAEAKPDPIAPNAGVPAVLPTLTPKTAGLPALPALPVGPVRPSLPEGWIDFRHPKGEYSVYVPRKPQPLPAKRDRDMPAIAGFNESGYYTPNTTIERPELVCGMLSVFYPPEVMQAFRTGNLDLSIVERMFPGMKMTTNRITWLGRPAIDVEFHSDLGGMMAGLPGGAEFGKKLGQGEMKLPNGLPTKNTLFMRYVVVNDRVYAFTIQNMYGPPTEAERRAFFDSVVLGK